jgi:HAD superfamily hydrolase (TIGR01490 family)
MQKRRVAVFDVDGTIFRSSLLIEVVDRLIVVGAFSEKVRKEFEAQREKWLNREGDYEEYIQAVVKSFLKHLKGVQYNVLSDAAEIVVKEHSKRVYRYTRDLLKELKSKEYFLLAVSHSPKTVLDKFCPHLGFDKVYGTFYETGAEGAFTGGIVDEHIIFNKAAVLKRAVEKEHLTLAHSVGVGDTESDIAFLELVAKPICFNPNQKLYRHARREGWNVVVERKDVIYQL